MVRMTVGMLRGLLREEKMPVKAPQTLEQKRAMIDLLKWASTMMPGSHDEAVRAIDAARNDDWQAALDLLSTYYMMKGIRARTPGKGPVSRRMN